MCISHSFINSAIKIANQAKNPNCNYKHAAILFKGNKQFSFGFNQVRAVIKGKIGDRPSLHAEDACLYNYNRRHKQWVLWT